MDSETYLIVETKKKNFIDSVKANLAYYCVEVVGTFVHRSAQAVAAALSEALRKYVYKLSLEKEMRRMKWSEFSIAVLLALGFIDFFIILQKIGIANVASSEHISYGRVLLIGIIASLSTYMPTVGGLVLAVSANFAKGGDTVKPQVLLHAGRFIVFFLLGGFMGAFAPMSQFGATGGFIINFLLSFLVGMFMLILGINLLDVFPWIKKIEEALPMTALKRLLNVKEINRIVTPFIVAVVTFFLPYRMTQLQSLATGSFFADAMTMFVFALGTLPMLALLSFAPLAIHDKIPLGIFFKTAGLVVIAFAIVNVINSLVVIGVLPQIFNF